MLCAIKCGIGGMVIMRLPRARVRTYMLLVGIVAVLVWAAMMGSRSYDSYQRARIYRIQSAIGGRSRNVTSVRAIREPSRRHWACRSPTATHRWCGSIVAQCGAHGSPSSTSPRSSTPPARPLPRSPRRPPATGNTPERSAAMSKKLTKQPTMLNDVSGKSIAFNVNKEAGRSELTCVATGAVAPARICNEVPERGEILCV